LTTFLAVSPFDLDMHVGKNNGLIIGHAQNAESSNPDQQHFIFGMASGSNTKISGIYLGRKENNYGQFVATRYLEEHESRLILPGTDKFTTSSENNIVLFYLKNSTHKKIKTFVVGDSSNL
jgi:hypothetical protein